MSEEKLEISFYDWLREQFHDLETAKIFGRKFLREMNQITPYGEFTQRAMAAHISRVLEGKDEIDVTCYINELYGVDIYWSM